MSILLHIVTLAAPIAFAVGYLYLIALYWRGLRRSRHLFFWILLASTMAFFVLAVVDIGLVVGGTWIRYTFGAELFTALYVLFLGLQPFALVVALVGHTFMVQTIVRSCSIQSGTRV